MDIRTYDWIIRDLILYNDTIEENYGNVVCGVAPTEPTYPLTIIDEIKNVGIKQYHTMFDKLSNISYRIDIYAQDVGTISKQIVARTLAKELDTYMSNFVGLTQLSYNVIPIENDNSLYHIVLIYIGNYHENRNNITQ
jgi:hypothetical protein